MNEYAHTHQNCIISALKNVFGFWFCLPFDLGSMLHTCDFFTIWFDFLFAFVQIVRTANRTIPQNTSVPYTSCEVSTWVASLFANFIKCMQGNITCLVLNAINSIKYLFCVEIDIDLWMKFQLYAAKLFGCFDWQWEGEGDRNTDQIDFCTFYETSACTLCTLNAAHHDSFFVSGLCQWLHV